MQKIVLHGPCMLSLSITTDILLFTQPKVEILLAKMSKYGSGSGSGSGPPVLAGHYKLSPLVRQFVEILFSELAHQSSLLVGSPRMRIWDL